MRTNCIISVKNVDFAYKNTPVLQGVNLTINAGDYVGIMGKNGSGKSTLLKLILNQLKPQSGQITILNSIHIGYVEQITQNNDNSFPASVHEIIMLGLYEKIGRWKFARTKHKKQVQYALSLVGMEDYQHRQMSQLSGGQQQKVIIAKALVSNPQLLILDEPTSGIDAESEKKFYKILQHLNTYHNITIIIVSHDIDKIKGVNKMFLVDNYKVKEQVNV